MSASDLYWADVDADMQEEHTQRLVEQARVAASQVWPFLAAATSREDYYNRKALADDRIVEAVSKVANGDPATHATLYPMVVETLDEDFHTLHEAREREAARKAREERGRRGRDSVGRGRREVDRARRQHQRIAEKGADWDAGFDAGYRDGRDNEDPKEFPDSSNPQFAEGYRAGYKAGQESLAPSGDSPRSQHSPEHQPGGQAIHGQRKQAATVNWEDKTIGLPHWSGYTPEGDYYAVVIQWNSPNEFQWNVYLAEGDVIGSNISLGYEPTVDMAKRAAEAFISTQRTGSRKQGMNTLLLITDIPDRAWRESFNDWQGGQRKATEFVTNATDYEDALKRAAVVINDVVGSHDSDQVIEMLYDIGDLASEHGIDSITDNGNFDDWSEYVNKWQDAKRSTTAQRKHAMAAGDEIIIKEIDRPEPGGMWPTPSIYMNQGSPFVLSGPGGEYLPVKTIDEAVALVLKRMRHNLAKGYVEAPLTLYVHYPDDESTTASRKQASMEWWDSPEHAWLVVSVDQYPEAAEVANASSFSWVAGGKAYLEEDVDAGTFLDRIDADHTHIPSTYHEGRPPGNRHEVHPGPDPRASSKQDEFSRESLRWTEAVDKGLVKRGFDVEQLRRIVEGHQHEETEAGDVIDVQSANAILTVYDALSEDNRDKFASLPLEQAADVAWGLVASSRGDGGDTPFAQAADGERVAAVGRRHEVTAGSKRSSKFRIEVEAGNEAEAADSLKAMVRSAGGQDVRIARESVEGTVEVATSNDMSDKWEADLKQRLRSSSRWTNPTFEASMRKGAPFAGYESFQDCLDQNQDADDPSAYCGKIKHEVEGLLKTAGTIDWNPEGSAGERLVGLTDDDYVFYVDPDITGSGYYGVIEDPDGNVLYQVVDDTMPTVAGHLEAFYVEDVAVPKAERATEEHLFGEGAKV